MARCILSNTDKLTSTLIEGNRINIEIETASLKEDSEAPGSAEVEFTISRVTDKGIKLEGDEKPLILWDPEHGKWDFAKSPNTFPIRRITVLT